MNGHTTVKAPASGQGRRQGGSRMTAPASPLPTLGKGELNHDWAMVEGCYNLPLQRSKMV